MIAIKAIFLLLVLSAIILVIRMFHQKIATPGKTAKTDSATYNAAGRDTSSGIRTEAKASKHATAEIKSSEDDTTQTDTSKGATSTDITSESDSSEEPASPEDIIPKPYTSADNRGRRDTSIGIATEADSEGEITEEPEEIIPKPYTAGTDSSEDIAAENDFSNYATAETDSSAETIESNVFDPFLSDYTPYRIATKANKDTTWPMDESCTPVKIWILIREGTSFPRSLERINEIHDRISKSADSWRSKQEYELFKQWNNLVYGIQRLAEEGKSELEGLARRLKKRFPSLFDPSCIVFASVKDTICENSLNVFRKALFKNKQKKEEAKKGNEHTIERNRKRFIKEYFNNSPKLPRSKVFTLPETCTNMVNSYRTAIHEDNLPPYINEFYSKMSPNVELRRDRLNLSISMNDAQVIYEALASEIAWNPHQPSVWESVLTESFARTEDTVRDIVSYHQHGYSNEHNYKPVCLVFKEIIKFFKDDVMAKDAITIKIPIQYKQVYPIVKGKISFINNGMHLKLLAFLGLFDDFSTRVTEDRLWKLSKIGGFATNLIFVLLSCNNEKYVQFLHQEEVVQIPGSESKEKCKFDTFKKIIADKTPKCTFREMCEDPTS